MANATVEATIVHHPLEAGVGSEIYATSWSRSTVAGVAISLKDRHDGAGIGYVARVAGGHIYHRVEVFFIVVVATRHSEGHSSENEEREKRQFHEFVNFAGYQRQSRF